MAPVSEDCVVPAAIMKSLQDKAYDKRKNASEEITKIVRESDRVNQKAQIMKVIDDLSMDTESQNSNVRKGALMGLTAVANGIDKKNVPGYLQKILLPIFRSLHDSQSTVKFYSSDQLWKICVLVRNHILPHFKGVFSAVIDLSTETDEPVQSQAARINNTLLDIITETPEIQLVEFIPCLVEKLQTVNSATQAIVLRWLSTLLILPGINLIPFIPALSEGVFNIMSTAKERNHEFEKAGAILFEFNSCIEQNAKAGNSFRYVDMINILVLYANSDRYSIQKISFTMICNFIEFARKSMLPYSPGILTVIMKCKGQDSQDKEHKDTLKLVDEANAKLVSLVNDEGDVSLEESEGGEQISPEKLEDKMYLSSVIEVFEMELKNTAIACKTTVLRWLHHLNLKVPHKMESFVERIFPCLLKVICDPSDEIVILSLQVLAQVASSNFPNKTERSAGGEDRQLVPGRYFTRSLQQLLFLFETEIDRERSKMCFIVRELCLILPPEDIYRTFAKLLLNEDKLDFAKAMVQSLSSILFTAPELYSLRNKLIHGSSQESGDLFVCLYYTWCHSSVATLTLCLLTRNYDHAFKIVRVFGEIEITTDTLVELDKLIQMLESPVFAFLRLELTNPSANGPLVDTLLAILMLVPQTQSFQLLNNRIHSIPTPYLSKELSSEMSVRFPEIDFENLSSHFHSTQNKRKIFKRDQLANRLRSSLNISSPQF